ncbi:MAG: type IV pilus secretin PilQ [Deltaproteobacteria bacterium]|nr:type IV pilus secretin PilQ [Deltaproteobacteria bacterium]
MKSQKLKVKSQKLEAKSQKQEKSLPLASYILPFFLLFTVFYGCAAPRQEIKGGGAEKKVAIEKISVIEDGKGILIEASGNITYTAFKLSDPSRLVLDIPDVDVEKVRKPMDINNEFITNVTAASYGEKTTAPIARIEIGLKEGVIYDVKQGEGSIMVKLNHEMPLQQKAPAVVESAPAAEAQAGTAQKAAEPSAAPATEPVKQDAAKQEEPKASAAEETKTVPPAAEKKEEKKADKLLRIEAGREDSSTIIKVVGNGVIGDFNAFDIEKPAPPRIVVDVWNVKSALPGSGLAVNTSQIKKVRVGEYPNKIRLVFDANQKKLPPYAIERVENTLVITAGKGAVKKLEAAKTVAPQVPPEPSGAAAPQSPAPGASSETVAAQETSQVSQKAQEPSPQVSLPETYAEIKGIDFKQLEDKARLQLTLSKKAPYQLSKSPDETSLVLDIMGAVIPDEFKKTLDAADLNTPVAAISSFQAPTEPQKNVRILIKLKEKAGYNISQEDEKIVIDFPLMAAAQAAPKEAEIKSQESGVRSQETKEEKPMEEVKKEEASGYTGRKISLDFKDADINNILRLMAEVSNLNIIAGEDVKGKVSLRLIDVPWNQAFDIILKTNGLGKVQEGNVVRIMPLAKIKQESEEALASKKAKEKLEDLEIKLVPISYATASALEPQVKGLLSDRGTVTIESRTNTLIIKDIPGNIKNAVDLIKKLDTATPQVLIEARIIEAQSSFARDLGVQWGAATLTKGPESFNSAFGSTSTSPPSSLTPATPTAFIGSGGRFSAQPTYAVSLPASGSAGPLGAVGFSFGTLTGDPLLLDLRISAGEKNGLTKTISRPRITTLDNKEAKISQGDSVPFETTSSSGTQTQFIDATLELTVTPHITPDGSVSMKIKASRNSIGSFRSAAGTPSISKKEASTEIIVKDGETAVIGGIVVADKSEATSGIPFFKDIPILGWLFKNNSVADSQTELLIFITPNIVKGKVELSPS